jgi:prepilin-type N-terminal cleavage/methylation domain-containing protein/prepilin-type processing-associated H-X9-DG protein
MKTRAFTLIELLVVIAIISVLAGLSFSAITAARRSGDQAREIAAGRQLMAAYILAASDNDGELLSAYAASGTAKNEAGQTVTGPTAQRYPWRLAAYLGGKVFGTLLVNDQAKLGQKSKRTDLDYLVSFAPTFGMNATYVGGNFKGSLTPGGLAEKKYGHFCVTRTLDVVAPAKLIVFCSAHYTGLDGMSYLGYNIVNGPAETKKNWNARSYKEGDSAEKLGYIHPRYNGRAVVVMFDGHTELLTPTELEDMRRWSNQAADLDLAEFVIGQN